MSNGPFTPRGENWVLAGNGQPYWPEAPKHGDVDLGVIVWSLAQKVRFGGHGRIFYSVAQHSVLVSELAEAIFTGKGENPKYVRELAWHALFHDAHEAYLADIPSPIKKLPWLEEKWRKLEDDWDRVIFDEFGVSNAPIIRQDVKVADLTAMLLEGKYIMPDTPGEWQWPGHGTERGAIKGYAEKYEDLLDEAVGPYSAEALFMERFRELRIMGAGYK